MSCCVNIKMYIFDFWIYIFFYEFTCDFLKFTCDFLGGCFVNVCSVGQHALRRLLEPTLPCSKIVLTSILRVYIYICVCIHYKLIFLSMLCRTSGWSSPSGRGRWRGGFILCALEVRLLRNSLHPAAVKNMWVKR